MRFNQLLFCGVVISAGLLSCAAVNKDTSNDNIIGQKLEAITPLRSTDGSQKQTVALYDETIKKIHQFDLNQMAVQRTLPVLNPDSQHFVLHSGSSNYIVDLSEKHVSIFDKNSNAQHQPITFQGKPKSAAFRPDLGWLVIYDDLQSVGLVRLAQDGQVMDSHTFGSVVLAGQSIVSGDLRDDGHLLLALSDNSIVDVDIAACLATKTWVAPVVHSTAGLGKINWLAPLAGFSNQRVLIKTSSEIVLFDLSTNLIIESMPISADGVKKVSKSYNPHIVLATSGLGMKLVYTDGTKLLTRQFQILNEDKDDFYDYPILSSDLDLQSDSWTYVFAKHYYGSTLNFNINQRKQNRQLVRMRISDGLSLQSKSIVDNAQIKLGIDYFFALYPSVLGKAEKFPIIGDGSQILRNFNLKQF